MNQTTLDPSNNALSPVVICRRCLRKIVRLNDSNTWILQEPQVSDKNLHLCQGILGAHEPYINPKGPTMKLFPDPSLWDENDETPETETEQDETVSSDVEEEEED